MSSPSPSRRVGRRGRGAICLLFRRSISSWAFSRHQGFTAAVLGGIGNVVAPCWAPFPGIAESLFPNLVLDGLASRSLSAQGRLAFVMLVLVLIFRPTGILASGWRPRKREGKP